MGTSLFAESMLWACHLMSFAVTGSILWGFELPVLGMWPNNPMGTFPFSYSLLTYIIFSMLGFDFFQSINIYE